MRSSNLSILLGRRGLGKTLLNIILYMENMNLVYKEEQNAVCKNGKHTNDESPYYYNGE